MQPKWISCPTSDFDSPVNHGHLCVRGRYETWAEPRQRILQPMVRRHGKLAPATWDLARLLTSRSLCLISASQFFTNVGWVFLMTWAPRYFQTVHRLPVEERALLVSIPPLVGWFGTVLGGEARIGASGGVAFRSLLPQ